MKEKLLPNYFKRIGFVLASLSFLFLIINYFNSDLLQSNELIIKWIFKDILLISLLVMAFSKDKNESKEFYKLKYKSLKNSFLLGAGILIFESITELAFAKDGIDTKSGYEIIVFIVIWYLLNFHWDKNHQKSVKED